VPKTKYRQALSLDRQTGEDQLIWGSLNNTASLLSDCKGDLPQAEATYRQLLEIDRNSGKMWRMDFTRSNLGAVLAAEGHLVEARRLLTEVQDGALKNTGRLDFGSSTITLARIDLAEGQPQDAEARLHPMAKVLEEDKHGFAVIYYDEIAAVQLAEKNAAEAQRTAAHARQLLSDTKTGFDTDHLATTEAKSAAAVHPNDPSVQARSLARLREIQARGSKSGFYSRELEARLAEGEIEFEAVEQRLGRNI
jgi:tetratricopeptide (TPR) repeat protein